MTITVASGQTIRANPSTSVEDALTGVSLSPSGNFIAAYTDSILTVFCLSYSGFSFVGSLDVADIVDSAGSEFDETEGTFSDVCWDPTERMIFVATRFRLIGIVRIEPVVIGNEVDETESESPDGSPAFGTQIYSMRLATVLLFPVDSFRLTPSRSSLIVVSQAKRVIFLIDWRNYQARAGRFVIPSMREERGSDSPCVNSVLPASDMEVDAALMESETNEVKQATIVECSNALLLLYEDGIIKSLAYSKPAEDICVLLPCPRARTMSSEDDRLAIICLEDPRSIYVYKLHSHSHSVLLLKVRLQSSIHEVSWSSGFLALAHDDGISILNRSGTGILVQYPTGSACSNVQLSLGMNIFVVVEKNAPEIEVISLMTSAGSLSRSSSIHQESLLIGRNSLRLYTFPARDFRYIPLPAAYVQDNGVFRDACVQLNASSQYIVGVGNQGFALWSASTLSVSSANRQEGRWEVLAEKSQEAKIGEIDMFGFLSDTVFYTHSVNSNEILLWSVLKRIDLSFTLGTCKLLQTPGDDAFATSDSGRGLLAIAHPGRVEIYQLKADSVKATYKLELITKLPCDFPHPLRQLVLVENYTILGISVNNELFLRTGERVCGNVDKVFVIPSIGEDTGTESSNRLISQVSAEDASSTGAFTPPRAQTPVRGGSSSTPESVESSQDDGLYEDDIDMNDDNVSEYTTAIHSEEGFSSPIVYFIGEKDCRFCANVSRIPKIKKRVAGLLRRRNPMVFVSDIFGNMSAWAVGAAGGRFAGRLEYIVRFTDSVDVQSGATAVPELSQIMGISGKWGVMASINGSDTSSHISLTSVIHPLLMVLPPRDAYSICRSLQYSPFLSAIVEMWLHSALSDAVPILSKMDSGSYNMTCLTASSDSVCQHPVVRTVLDKLLHAFGVVSHFPSVYPSVFAAAVRKSEPHLTFPLATCGALSGQTCETLFQETLRRGRLREAALLLVIIQESTGPITVREKFAIPLFREALIAQDYELGRDIAHFHFSYSTRLRSPITREFAWKPSPNNSVAGEEDMSEELLRTAIETVVIAHLNQLINESMDWLRLIRFVESLRLVFGEWLPAVPRQEYMDLSQLVLSFRLMLSVCPSQDWANLTAPLVEGFRRAKWIAHWKAIAIAADSTVLLRDCLEQTKDDNSSVVTEMDVRSIIDKYII